MASLAVGLWSLVLALFGAAPTPTASGGVLVTPDLASRSVPAHSGAWDAVFFVKNTGTTSKTFTLSCSGVASCTMSPTSVTLGAGAQADVDALYTTGNANPSGSLIVSASAGATNGSGSMALDIGPSMVLMTGPGPDANATQTVHRSRPVLRADFVLPSGEATDTTSIKIWWKGVLASGGTLRRNAAMLEWEVPSDQALTPGDTGTFKVQHCLVSTVCTTESRIIQLPADQKPVVDFVGMPFEATGGGFSTGFGPGLAVSGVDVTTGFATPAYVSMGSARSAALVYSTRTSYPRALVAVDLNLPWGTGTGDSVLIFLRDSASVKQDSLKVPSSGCKTGTAFRCRLVLQASYPASITAGVVLMNYSVEVTAKSGATTKVTTEYVPVVLVDRRTSPYGSGWWPAAGIRLYAAGQDRVLVGPTGSATIYRGSGDSLYLPPPGSTTNLVKVSGGWELRTRGTPAKVVFDANGRVVKGVDASGNKDSLTYGTGDRLASLIDPTGRTITFYYGSVTAKLDSIVTLSGTGDSRRTRVSIDTATNQLRYDSLPSPSARPVTANYAYDTIPGGSKGTGQLKARWGRFGIDSVFVTYDASTRYRPRLATLRAPLSSPGDTVRPVLTYHPADLRGFGALDSLNDIYVEVIDPRGNWTRSLLTRYAQSIKTWDAIDTFARDSLDGFGRVVWAEGRTADSSRVYASYDSLGRAYRSFVRRTSSDTLWLSRLTFDANDRVVKRLDPLGHADSMAYDAYGRPVYTRDAAGNVTRVWYRTDGLVDSMLSPTSTLAQHFTYTSSWLNPQRVYVAGDSLSSETQYDAQGIANGSKGKFRVRLTGSQSTWRWRLTTTWRDVAGRPDSSTVYQTADCSSPCNTPGTFTRITSHYVTYDSLGQVKQERDSGTAVSTVTYIRDRLGRVIESQRNGAQGDSLVYDLAGNVITTVTRRGYQLQAYYDSRNRDTSAVIPGYGTVKRIFGGPEGQLTSIGVSAYVDSIGSVEPGRKWVYDKRGRLLSDTLWTGTGQPRATTYSYDRYDRDTLVVDARGASGTRVHYDTTLGRLSGVHTPFGDSLRFVWDATGRPQQAQVVPDTGGRILTQAWTFTGDGMLQTAGATLPSGSGLAGYDAGTWADYGDFADANLGITLLPEWTRQDGDGTTLHTEKDSLRYDGLERLTRWKGMTDGALVASDSFAYDASGNLIDANETRTYQSGTNRLTYRVAAGKLLTYTYDVAGNLSTIGDSTYAPAHNCWWGFTYDALDRLTQVRVKPKFGDTVLVARYAYDVLGNRIARRVYAQASGCSAATPQFIRYAVQGGHVLFETDGGGSTKLREYVWGLGTDDLVAVRIPAGADSILYPVKDQLGTIRAWVTRAGTWRWGGRYRPYGVQAESRGTEPDVPYKWTGREYDPETGFYFLRARYYDPTVGRFTQEDPIGLAGGSNLYAYVNGQPLEATDPSGLESEYVAPYTWCSPTGGGCVSWDGQLLQADGMTSERPSYLAGVLAIWQLYIDYLNEYNRNMNALEGRTDEGARILLEETRAMKREEFKSIMSDLADLGSVYHVDLMQTGGKLISEGRLTVLKAAGYDRMDKYNGGSDWQGAYIPGTGFAVVRESFFTFSDPKERAFTIEHEWVHHDWYASGRPEYGDECAVNAHAQVITGYYGHPYRGC